MATAGGMTVPVSRAMSNVTLEVRVTGLRALGVKVWIARQLIGLAAWTLGCAVGVSFDVGPTDTDVR